jgi:hypothetical protein
MGDEPIHTLFVTGLPNDVMGAPLSRVPCVHRSYACRREAPVYASKHMSRGHSCQTGCVPQYAHRRWLSSASSERNGTDRGVFR